MSVGKLIALIAAVALIALAVWKRRRLGGERTGIAVLAGLGVIVWASGLASHLPNPQKAIEDIARALGPWTYALVGVMAFLETGAFVGLIAPGEFTVIVGGVVAGQGEIAVVPLIGLAWLCCILGDTASFFVGRRLGRAFIIKHGPRVKISEERLEKVEGYFARHGGKTVLIGRFIGLIRAVAPFIAGSSGMRYRAFLPFSVIGTGLWATAYTLLGFFFYRSFQKVAHVAGQVTLAFGALVAIVVGGVWCYRRLRVPENRRTAAAWLERQGERPLLRPVAAVVRPLWRHALRPLGRFLAPELRFLWERMTPGGLGAELTTALAVAAVGSYVFVLSAMDVMDSHKGATAYDNRVFDLVDRLRADWLVHVAKVVTAFGSATIVGGLIVVALALLAWRRRPLELAMLATGSALVYVGAHVSKAAFDRPRPPAALVDTGLSSFPSGHAAYSTAYVVMGVIAARVLPGRFSRAALVAATVVIAALIGASRTYLRAHYASDVAAGWALGATIFAACGIVALVVAYVRNNGGEHRARPARPAPAVDH